MIVQVCLAATAIAIGLLLGFALWRFTVPPSLVRFPDLDGLSWTEEAMARYAVNDKEFLSSFKVADCIREPGHDGPCNGWPCATVRKRMRDESRSTE